MRSKICRGKSDEAKARRQATCQTCKNRQIAEARDGVQKHPHYRRWWGMKQRCYNPNNTGFETYGGRGITICDEWLDFSVFSRWADATYEQGKTIDRIDSDGPYSPANCRWATPTTQANNTRRNHVIEHNGRSQSVRQWALELGFAPRTLYDRINNGWPVERALTEPVNRREA